MKIKKKTTTVGETVSISYAHGEMDFSDLVYVVRCGQCKFFQSSGCFVGIQGAQISSDNYCAWGQRKMDKNNYGVKAIPEERRVPFVVKKDVVEVVRCKDCKLLFSERCPKKSNWPNNYGDYCSYGERKYG